MDKNVTCKRININSEGFHILCIPYDDGFMRFQVQHDKYTSVLVMFDGNRARVENEKMLYDIARLGFDAYRDQYMAMIEAEANA